MMKLHVLFSAMMTLMFALDSAHARPVDPKEKLGQLQVVAPDVSHTDFQFNKLKLAFRVTNSSQSEIALGKETLVAAGSGCLSVSYSDRYQYTSTRCGIVIEEKKLTIVRLAGLSYSWNPSLYDVDLGPAPQFVFFPGNTQEGIVAKFDPAKKINLNNVYLLANTQVELKLTDQFTGDLHSQITELNPGTMKTEAISAIDLRATLFLDFIDGAPTYPVPVDTYVEATFRKDVRPSYLSHLSSNPAFGRTGGEGHVLNAYRFEHKGVSTRVKAFPLGESAEPVRYEIVVNEHVSTPKLKSGQEYRLPVVTLNVNDYQTNRPGTFLFHSNRDGRDAIKEIALPGGNPLNLQRRVFETKSSLFVQIGFIYRFDFYIRDELGRESLQDQVTMDLTKE